MDSGLRKLRLSDVKSIRFLFPGETATRIEEYIRTLPKENHYLITTSSENKALITLEKGMLNSKLISFCFSSDINSYEKREIISKAIMYAFFTLNLHKIVTLVEEDDLALGNILEEHGFIQEAILHDEMNTNGSYKDCCLYYMLRPMNKAYQVSFVPFQRGIISIEGGANSISRILFHQYGSSPDDPFVFDCASFWSLLDENGLFRSRGDECYKFEALDYSELPFEVAKASLELREYFMKKRKIFDIVFDESSISEFERRVLRIVNKIPYGATCAYEEIALELTNGDYKEARRITRAVGNACSRNPVPIVVPCHRVIGKDGKLVGYSAGIEFKDFLLQNELFDIATPLN